MLFPTWNVTLPNEDLECRNKVVCGNANQNLRNFTQHPLPNEDFGSMNNRWNADFEGSTFQGREYSMGHGLVKSLSKIRMTSCVHPSKIFVWGAWISHPLPNEGTCIREYSTIISSLHGTCMLPKRRFVFDEPKMKCTVSLCSHPNEAFGRPNAPCETYFRYTFQGSEY